MSPAVLLSLLLAAGGADGPGEARYPGAVEVFDCRFDESNDKDYDGWPDHWTRQRGPGYPSFIHIAIHDEPSPTSQRCLRIDLDGGAAIAYSDPIAVAPLWNYVLEAYLKTDGLKNDRAFLSLVLLDAERQPLETFTSQKLATTRGWQKVRLGPVAAQNDKARLAIIGVHLEPQGDEDFKGSARFADLWLGRLPRIALQTSDPHNFFTEAATVEATCTVYGLAGNSATVLFQLYDALGQPMAHQRRQVDVTTAKAAASPARSDAAPAMASGTIAWQPPIPGPGFYRLRAEVETNAPPGSASDAGSPSGSEPLTLQEPLSPKEAENALSQHQPQSATKDASIPPCELSLVVVDSCRTSAGSEFGWSVPRGDRPLGLPALARLVRQAGVGWLKYPVWYDDSNATIGDQLVAFSAELSAQGIELVGMLSTPPPKVRQQYPPDMTLSAANVFRPEPKVWSPSLELVMSRPGMRIGWWQLGDDRDTSFVGYPKMAEKIAQVKTELDRIGYDVNLGMGWNWRRPLPRAAPGTTAPWRFLTLSADPPLSSSELAGHLDAAKKTKLHRWVVLAPPPREEASREDRAISLVQQMLAAKIHGASGIFCSNAFDNQRGLMNEDGSPGELFLPWRTTALMLGGATHLGSVVLPKGSANEVFARDGKATMVIWNDTPTSETLDLGQNIRQVDLWGRAVAPAANATAAAAASNAAAIQADRLPTFVTGMNEPMARWRVDSRFAKDRLPSVLGVPHANVFQMKNPLSSAISGQAKLVMPEAWKVEPRQIAFDLRAGEELKRPFTITLPDDVQTGSHQVHIAFDVQGPQALHFMVFRNIEVGLGDVYVEISSKLDAQGALEVTQRLVNAGEDRISFRCELFAPERCRLQTQMLNIGPGIDEKVYHLPNGEELLGKTLWLRGEEINGPRVLNYRFPARK